MKARVLVPLNIRTGTPEILPHNNTGDKYYDEGDVVDIAEAVIGEQYKDNNIWYKLSDGAFVWSGGVDNTDAQTLLLNVKFDYNLLIKNIPIEWKQSGGAGIKVVVMDTGISQDHADLKINGNNYFDFYYDGSNKFDKSGHGTEVAGIVGGNAAGNGIKGIAPLCELISFKTTSDENDTAELSLKKAIPELIKLAANHNNLVVNCSWNIDPSDELDKLFESIPSNMILVCAAGNNRKLTSNSLLYPSALKNTISVGFINNELMTDVISQGSFNSSLDYVFIGSSLVSCSIPKQSSYNLFSSCSMATALVTGIVALFLSSIKSTNRIIDIPIIRNLLNTNFPSITGASIPSDLITIYKIKN